MNNATRREPKFTPQADAREICRQLREAADTLPWKGQTGRTDRNIYNAALRFAEDTSCLTVRLAHREMMKQAGIGSRKTVQTSMSRLRKKKLIRNSGATREWDEGTPYTLTTWLLRDQPPTRTLSYLTNPDIIPLPGTPLAVYLGNTALTAYATLTVEPLSRNQLAAIARMHPTTAGRALRVLEIELLAVRTSAGWTRGISPTEWEHRNPFHPAHFKVEQRHLQIDREREEYRAAHREATDYMWVFRNHEWKLINRTTGEVVTATEYDELKLLS